VLRLVVPGSAAEVPAASRALVASLCGQEDWNALMAALDKRGRGSPRAGTGKEGS
jgi:glutamate-ammonia-ligase adenylyltransferase